MVFFSGSYHLAGLRGLPRRVYSASLAGDQGAAWHQLTVVAAFGSFILLLSALCYLSVVVGTWTSGRRVAAPAFEFATPLHPEPDPTIWDRFGMWSVLAAALVAIVATGTAMAAGGNPNALVTNSNDSGPGSFRAAIDKANADPGVRKIVFRIGLAPIQLVDPVAYTRGQSLEVLGNGAVLDGGLLDPADAEAFLVTGGGNLSISLLTIRNAPQQGLTYQVPVAATGTM